MDELKAVEVLKNILNGVDYWGNAESDYKEVQVWVLRAILARATRPHD